MHQIQNVAIFAKLHDPRCLGIASDLIHWLEENGCTPMPDEQLTRQLGCPDALTIEETREQAELVVVLGGTARLSRWPGSSAAKRCRSWGSIWEASVF